VASPMPLEAPVINTLRLEADLDVVISLVACRTEAVGLAGAAVLGTPAAHTLAPGAEGTGAELGAHQGNHISFREPELKFDRLKGGAIFPGHFDHSIDLPGRELVSQIDIHQ